jgi:hypothetical protein
LALTLSLSPAPKNFQQWSALYVVVEVSMRNKMRELKWNWVYYTYLDAPNKQEESALKAGYIKVVSKDDADKVIAEFKDKLQNVSELLNETREWLIESQRLHKRCADGATKKIRHQKYKRWLAIASNCRLRARWFGDNAFYKKGQWALQWHRRWLELAEKFKPNKEAK